MEHENPRKSHRVAALLFGPSYITWIGFISHGVTDTPLWLTLLTVWIGAILIAAVILVFGLKAFHAGPSGGRFRLSSILLVLVPMSIYLAGLRFFFANALERQSGDTLNGLFVAIFSTVFIGLTSLMLLWTTEAFLWLAVTVLNWCRRRKQSIKGG